MEEDYGIVVPSVDSQQFCKDGVRWIASVLLYASDGVRIRGREIDKPERRIKEVQT